MRPHKIHFALIPSPSLEKIPAQFFQYHKLNRFENLNGGPYNKKLTTEVEGIAAFVLCNKTQLHYIGLFGLCDHPPFLDWCNLPWYIYH